MWEMYTFFYLGLPIGGDLRRLGFWEPAVTRILKRLSRWKSCFLSFGGCFILLKSVLTCLRSFFLGGRSEDLSKISWISWKTICLHNEYGGMEVRQLREFNISLLGKWCWRLLVI
jgi:hypothetical protein